MQSDERARHRLWPLGVLAIGGLLLRQAGQSNWSYWLDEAMQVSYVRGSFTDMLAAVRFDGVHPPLDYAATWCAFHLGGGRERVLRLLPGVWTVLAALAAFAFAGGWKRPIRAFGAALFLVAVPLSVYLGQEVRPYALSLFLTSLTFAVLRDAKAIEDRRKVAAAATTSALSCLTLYLSVVPLAALWSSVIWHAARQGRLHLRRALLLPLPSILSLGAWLYLVRGSLVHPGEQAPVHLSVGFALSLLNGLLGWREETRTIWAGSLLSAPLILAGITSCVRAREGRHLLSLLGTTLGTVLVLALAHHWINVRYLAPALVPAAFLFGSGVELLARRRVPIAAFLMLGFLALNLPAYAEIHRSARPNWRQVAAYLAFQEERHESGRILGLDPWSYLCLRSQPLVATRVVGFIDPASPGKDLNGEGWLVRTPHYRAAFDPSALVGRTRPWGRFPQSEDAHVYRFRNGVVLPP